MTADSCRANRWNLPFGAGRETTSGFILAALVRSRGARASTVLRRAVFRVTTRRFRALTPTFLPRATRGFRA